MVRLETRSDGDLSKVFLPVENRLILGIAAGIWPRLKTASGADRGTHTTMRAGS